MVDHWALPLLLTSSPRITQHCQRAIFRLISQAILDAPHLAGVRAVTLQRMALDYRAPPLSRRDPHCRRRLVPVAF
jgi:hypothetical protein